MTYCDFAVSDRAHPVHAAYHATEYGFPATDEHVLFERLILEIFQAGLSWETVLRKRDGFTSAFRGFDVATVAAFTERDVERLLGDAGIIRNKLKIAAAIHNANVILGFEHGFSAWLEAHHPLPKEDWVRLFKHTFKFTGGEIVGEFLMSLGYLPGAHVPTCPVHAQTIQAGAPWSRV